MSPDPEGSERIWVFPGWGWLYLVVVVYGLFLIGLLTILTRLLDFGGGA